MLTPLLIFYSFLIVASVYLWKKYSDERLRWYAYIFAVALALSVWNEFSSAVLTLGSVNLYIVTISRIVLIAGLIFLPLGMNVDGKLKWKKSRNE